MDTNDENSALPETVARMIAKRIASGQYPPGSRVPTVRELATDLDVSVVTVRIAIAVLEAALLVETSPRVGTTVRDPVRDGGVRAWALLADREHMDVKSLQRYFSDALVILEATSLNVVSDLPNARDLSVVQGAVDRLQKVVNATPRDHHRAMEAQIEVVRSVLLATDHPMYLNLLNELHALAPLWHDRAEMIVPDPPAMALRWRVLMAMLPQLDETNVRSMVKPLIRAAVEDARQWLTNWVAVELRKRAIS